MRRLKKPVVLSFVLSLIMITVALSGCSNESQNESKNKDSKDEVKTVTVGIGNSAPPFCYIDENGEIAGYDYELLKKVDEKLEDYNFDYQTFEFKTLLTAVETGQVDMGSHNVGKNEEREKLFIFGDEVTLVSNYHIITLADSDYNPQTWDDLAGHTVYTKVGAQDATFIDEYNSEHEKKINSVFGEQGDDIVAQSLKNGESDAKISSLIQGLIMNKNFDNAFKISEKPLFESYGYFFYPKGNEELRDKVDIAVKELKEEGVLEELYQEYYLDYPNK